MHYAHMPSFGQPPAPACVLCEGPTDLGPNRVHTVITKHPTGKTSVLCQMCFGRVLDEPALILAAELATTLDVTVPALQDFFIRQAGYFEIPITSLEVDRALGLPLGFTRGVWSDR